MTWLTHFANPVQKILDDGSVTPIKNKHRHLTWYNLHQEQTEPVRTVWINNQFGQQRVVVQDPISLLVPAEKTSDPDSRLAERLDHYKCYEIVDVIVGPETHSMSLQDQFGGLEDIQLGDPKHFCNPVRKERAGQVEDVIKRPHDHLTLYSISVIDVTVDFTITDQFLTEQDLQTDESRLLAVPTRKRGFDTQ